MNVSHEKVSQSIQITLIHKSINHPANQRQADVRQTKILVPERERETLMMNQCWLAADCLADPCSEELQH